MNTERVTLREEQATMLGTLVGRARDAGRTKPILGDQAAAEAMTRIDYDFDTFEMDDQMSAAVAVRGKLFDDRVRGFLAQHPDAVVLHLGSGLDTRWQRIAPGPGVTWYEVDHPGVINLRRRILADETTSHPLIASSVTDPHFLDTVPDGRPTLVVAEGLTMYLRPETGWALFTRLGDRFTGEAIIDVFSTLGIKLQLTNRVVRKAGAKLYWGIDDPAAFERIGLRVLESVEVDRMWGGAAEQLGARTRFQLKVAGAVPAFRTLARLLRLEL
ncbi:class I SAM-dependent methyltransferase [Propionibacteriaceae bacterium Y1685]